MAIWNMLQCQAKRIQRDRFGLIGVPIEGDHYYSDSLNLVVAIGHKFYKSPKW